MPPPCGGNSDVLHLFSIVDIKAQSATMMRRPIERSEVRPGLLHVNGVRIPISHEGITDKKLVDLDESAIRSPGVAAGGKGKGREGGREGGEGVSDVTLEVAEDGKEIYISATLGPALLPLYLSISNTSTL